MRFGAGASGGIGQPLSLLLKMNERVDVLSLYDVVGTPGVGADVGHIDSIAKVRLDCCVHAWLQSWSERPAELLGGGSHAGLHLRNVRKRYWHTKHVYR